MPAVIGVIMGSTSDWDTMKKACDVLDELEIAYEKKWFLLIVHQILCFNMQNKRGNVV